MRSLEHRTAVVLCEGAGGLGAVRALHKHRVPTIAVAFDRRATVLASRLPRSKVHVAAGGRGDLDGPLLAALRRLGREHPVLLPTSDRMVSFMHRNESALAGDFSFYLPDARLAETLNDKHAETRLIASLAIPLPRTVQDLPANAGDLERALGLPLIIKARSSEHKHVLGRANVVATTREQLEAFYERHAASLAAVLAQEVIPGADDTLWLCSGVFNRRHELVQALVKRKLKMSPPHFGVCSLAVSAANRDVLDLARLLGERLGYTGHASIEFKWDHRDGLYKYIEVNPRIPASVSLDEASDVSTVWTTYRIALGDEVAARPLHQHDGVIYVKLLEDVVNRLADGERFAAILGQYLRLLFRRRVGAHFAWHDPRPGIAFAWWFGRTRLASLRRPLRSALVKAVPRSIAGVGLYAAGSSAGVSALRSLAIL